MPTLIYMNVVHLSCGKVGCMLSAMNMMPACFTMLNASSFIETHPHHIRAEGYNHQGFDFVELEPEQIQTRRRV